MASHKEPRKSHQDYRLLLAAVGFWIGCYAAKQLSLSAINPFLLGCAGSFIIAVMSAWLRPRHSYPERWELAIALLLAGCVAGTIVGVGNNRSIAADPLNDCKEITFSARVATSKPMAERARKAAGRGAKQQLSVLELDQLHWCEAARCHITRQHIPAFTQLVARPGDRLTGVGKCQKREYIWADRPLFAAIAVKNGKVYPQRTFAKLVTRRIAESGAEEASFLIAVLTGDTGIISAARLTQLQRSGLAHLLAVSGLHLSILIGFTLLLLAWAPRLVQFLGVAGAIGLAFALVGWRISLLRAAVMALVAALGILSGRRTYSFAALALALFVILLRNPAVADSFSLGLSFLVTASLLSFSEPIARWLQRWVPRRASRAIAVPIAAQIAATPLIAALSGAISLSSVPANLAAVPAATPLLIATLVIAITPHSWIGSVAVWIADCCAQWILTVSAWAAAIAQIPWPRGWLGAAIMTICMAGVAYWVRQVKPLYRLALWRDYWAERK